MPVPALKRSLLLSLLGLFLMYAASPASAAPPPASRDADLQMVVVLSRHGVRSLLTRQADLDKYSAAPWPKWDVAPGILTAHGYELIKLFGVWDRSRWSDEGLLAPTGCADAAHVTIVADIDERTRETGKALTESIFPGCNVAVHSQPGGTSDPLFRPLNAGVSHPDPALTLAAIKGRIGVDLNQLTEAYRPQLTALDRVLAGCGRIPNNPNRTSIFDVPTSLTTGPSDPLASMRGPLPTAATLTANLLLEYTQGMSDADTGWGCLDDATLRYLMQLDSASWDYSFRTPAVARAYASNLLDHILETLEQGASGKPVAGAVGKPGDRVVILVGHDTNIVTVAGTLGVNWIIDGRVDDTPPGGALIFELWRPRRGGEPFVRLEYTAQTLEQMRKSEPLSLANPPAAAPLFVPGCSRADLSCTWGGFSAAVRRGIDPAYVSEKP